MMKRKILMVGLVLALALTLVTPAAALAKPESHETLPFTATAQVIVVDPGVSTNIGTRIMTHGEKIEGIFISVAGWPALEGASLSVDHSSIITLSLPDPESGIGTYNGKAWARIGISMNGGKLFGIYQAELNGEYQMTPDGQLVILWVLDEGTFRVVGSVLEDGHTFIKADGEWAASLNLTQIGSDWTLAGLAQIAGEYQKISSGHRACSIPNRN
jgi:hypothetical protein